MALGQARRFGGLAALPQVRPQTGQEAAAWLKSNLDGYYSRPARVPPYRSSAAWALRQMDDRFSILRPDTVVLDLGCFPGGWSEVAVERSEVSSSSSRVIGVDSTRMDPMEYHTFIQGDLAKKATTQAILAALGDTRADVVLSDLSPASTGLKQEDHLNSMQCCLHAAKIMERTLKLGGWFALKLTYGSEIGRFRMYLDSRFETVRAIRPAAVRSSRDMFCICKGFIGRQTIASEAKSKNAYTHEGMDRWNGERWLSSQEMLDEDE
ncbi:unnamed protein product [Effrenium voratum]|nr:unnamed protein product [Effrenium voratum]